MVQDQRLAKFVCNSHVKHHPRPNERSEPTDPITEAPIPQELLKKYIVYARQYIHPTLEKIDQNKIAKMYSQLRQEALATGSMPITARHIESLIRMSEAHARIHLRDVVVESDVNVAIRIMLESFVETQKFSVMKAMKKVGRNGRMPFSVNFRLLHPSLTNDVFIFQAFHKYLSYGRETDEILYFFLRELTIHHLGLARSRGTTEIVAVRVPERDLLMKVLNKKQDGQW